MAEPKHNILFPIETLNREMDYRLFLAAMFAHPSRRIFIGYMHRINRMIRWMRGGLYFGKHIYYRQHDQMRYYRWLKTNGFAYMHLTEESAVYDGPESEWGKQMDAQFNTRLLSEDDYGCTWGEHQARYHSRSRPELAPHLRATGHPRFDLCKPQFRDYFREDIDSIRNRYGRFILINTNMGRANHGKGLFYMFHRETREPLRDMEQRTLRTQQWSNSSLRLAALVQLVLRMAQEFRQTNFVLRPHPSESIEFYRTAFAGLDNVHVIHAGPVVPWIMAAAGLIHTGCTTALEARFSNIPLITFRPDNDHLADWRLPNNMGLICSDQDAVIDAVGKLAAGATHLNGEQTGGQTALELMSNFSIDSFAATMQFMQEALDGIAPPQQRTSMAEVILKERLWQLRDGPRLLARPLSRRRALHEAEHQKFPGFDPETVVRKMDAIQTLLSKRVSYRQVSSSLIVVDAA